MSDRFYDGDRSLLGDTCENHNPLTAPVVFPHRVWIDGESLRGEYLCACGRHWPCWWGMQGAGWTLQDVVLYAGTPCARCGSVGLVPADRRAS